VKLNIIYKLSTVHSVTLTGRLNYLLALLKCIAPSELGEEAIKEYVANKVGRKCFTDVSVKE
jgi:hypothetical protein